MDVQFRESYTPSFPTKCACCLAPTDETRQSYRHAVKFGLGDPKAKTTKLHVPYCRPCRDHVDWSVGGGLLGVVLSVPVNTLLAGMGVGLIVSIWRISSTWAYENQTLTYGIAIAVVVLIVTLLTWRRVSKRPDTAISRGHTRAGESVEVTGYTGRGVVTVRIHNPEFATEFANLNETVLPGGANL